MISQPGAKCGGLTATLVGRELAPEHLSLYIQLVSKSVKAKAIFEAFMMDKNGIAIVSPRREAIVPACLPASVGVASARQVERSRDAPRDGWPGHHGVRGHRRA